uniref:Uncharacterized protein n=1 Tax=Anguilla anguilla TaxID=7936 RepID=A0A0E9RPZ1_ANGAN
MAYIVPCPRASYFALIVNFRACGVGQEAHWRRCPS